MVPRDVATRLLAGTDPKNPIAEAFRTVRTNITFAFAERQPKTIVFSSPMPGDGKTTTTSNLAITMAQQGLRVLLIDADLRRGVLHSAMGVPRQPGLSNLLVAGQSLQDVVHSIEFADGVRLGFLATGTLPPNPAELLGSQRMRELLTEMESQFDAILIDSPPLNVVTDAAVLGTFTDGVIVVARAGVTTADSLRMSVDLLHHVRARVLGAVLNGIDFRRDSHYYATYGYGYHYNYYYQDDEAAKV
jgi:capsular exopolysaccharide synthesis family protein